MRKIYAVLLIFLQCSFGVLADELPDFQPITFDAKSYSIGLDRPTQQTLNNIIKFLETHPMYNLRVEGFCDITEGNVEQDFSLLSLQRAAKIRDYFVSHGLAKCRFVVAWRGSADPVAPHTTETQRRQNRRVELKVFLNEENNITVKHLTADYESLFDKKEQAFIFDSQSLQPYKVNMTVAFLKETIRKEDGDVIVVVCGLEQVSYDFQSQADFLKDSLLQAIPDNLVYFLPQKCQNDTIIVRLFDKNCKQL